LSTADFNKYLVGTKIFSENLDERVLYTSSFLENFQSNDILPDRTMLHQLQPASGLPDENLNKKPNSAKKRPEKGRTDYLKARKKAKLCLWYCSLVTKKI